MSEINLKGPILITGSKGILGTEFCSYLKNHFPHISVYETCSSILDITDLKAAEAFIKKTNPAWILNTAAYTDVDRAEEERDRAQLVNGRGPGKLSDLAFQLGARLVHFSTDYVFNGEGTRPWSETDLPNPVKPNWYAETKLEGELAVLKNPANLLFRVQWLYGLKKNRFSQLKNKPAFTPFEDQFGAPTWSLDIVTYVLKVMSKGGSGLFHFSYDDYASWFEVYQFVKEEWGLPIQLIPQKADAVHLPAKRPKNGRLSNEKLKQFLGISKIGSWKTSLRAFLSQVNS